MKKILIFLSFSLFLTSCTITIGDTCNCDGGCNKETTGDVLVDTTKTTIPDFNESMYDEYEVIEEK